MLVRDENKFFHVQNNYVISRKGVISEFEQQVGFNRTVSEIVIESAGLEWLRELGAGENKSSTQRHGV